MRCLSLRCALPFIGVITFAYRSDWKWWAQRRCFRVWTNEQVDGDKLSMWFDRGGICIWLPQTNKQLVFSCEIEHSHGVGRTARPYSSPGLGIPASLGSQPPTVYCAIAESSAFEGGVWELPGSTSLCQQWKNPMVYLAISVSEEDNTIVTLQHEPFLPWSP